jgi:hypothetical protein
VKKQSLAAAAAAAAFLSPGAMAQAYVGADFGVGHFSNVACDAGTSCSPDNTAWKVTGGYKLGAGFAGEAGYIDFGHAKAEVIGGARVDVAATAFTLGGAYEFALNERWAIDARLGLARVRTTSGWATLLDGSGTIDAFVIGSSRTDTAPYYGLGGTLGVGKDLKLEVAADWSRAQPSRSTSIVRSLTAGVRYEF